jgi:hypothetical protein
VFLRKKRRSMHDPNAIGGTSIYQLVGSTPHGNAADPEPGELGIG